MSLKSAISAVRESIEQPFLKFLSAVVILFMSRRVVTTGDVRDSLLRQRLPVVHTR